MRYMRTTNEGEKSVTLRNVQKRHASKRRPTNGEVCLGPTIMATKRQQTESRISRARFLCGLHQAAKDCHRQLQCSSTRTSSKTWASPTRPVPMTVLLKLMTNQMK